MVLYRSMIERKGYSAAAAKEQLKNMEPFHAYPALISALPDSL